MSELEQALAEALEARQAAIDRRDAERYRSLMDDVREQARRDGMVVSHIDVLARQAAIGAAVERLPSNHHLYWYTADDGEPWWVVEQYTDLADRLAEALRQLSDAVGLSSFEAKADPALIVEALRQHEAPTDE